MSWLKRNMLLGAIRSDAHKLGNALKFRNGEGIVLSFNSVVARAQGILAEDGDGIEVASKIRQGAWDVEFKDINQMFNSFTTLFNFMTPAAMANSGLHSTRVSIYSEIIIDFEKLTGLELKSIHNSIGLNPKL